jgi:acetoin utilization protein AcuB
MSKRIITVRPQDPVADAQALLHRYRIRQLPVLRQRRLVGIVTDRDLRSAPPAAKTVGELMSAKLIVIAPEASVDEAAHLLRAHKIGALPVVERSTLVGILTSSDILDAFVDISGVAETTYRVTLSGAQGKQAEQEVRQVVQRTRSELKWLQRDSRNPTQVHLRLKAPRIDDLVTGLEAAGFEVTSVVAPSRRRG